MSGKSFVHAHVHTDYSALDGAAKINALVDKVVELGQPGVAITDHGNSQGTHELWKVAKERGINAILGQEFYVAPFGYSRSHRAPVFYGDSGGEDPKERSNDVSGGGAYTHMTIWAENNEGKFNLFKLSTRAYLEGKYMKPRIDTELLSEHSRGLIGTTGCPSGEIQTRLRLGQWDKAIEYASQMQDILGKDNYYCEIMDHGLEIERMVKADLLRLAKELRIPLIATNDSHYVSSDQVDSHDHLLCISSGSTLNSEKRFKFSGDSYYIKSAEEMRELFKDHPEACDNTLELNERCNVSFDEDADLMPKFAVPQGTTDKEFLEKEVIRLIPERVSGWDKMSKEKQNSYFKQAEYECGVINLMGFASYFLVVADFVQWAKDNGIAVGPGRGCLSYANEVRTPNGYAPISTVKAGDEVLDGDGNIVIVPQTFVYPVEEKLTKLFLENGTETTLTTDHKVLVKKPNAYGDNDEWVKTKEVNVGDNMIILDPKTKERTYNKVLKTGVEDYTGEVYDFTIPTTHSYQTRSGIVHNSAGGCLVAYSLSITELDPIRHGLIFERFLNPDRVSMPDIDIDFDDKRRGEVIEYVTNKYGQDKVSQIITYTMMKAKSALKDATRILDYPYSLGDTLSKKFPPDVNGRGMKLSEVFDPNHERYPEAEEFRTFVNKGTAIFGPEMCKRVIEVALGIEGFLRTTGIHAAGVLMSSQPIAGIIPLMDPSTADKENSKDKKDKKKKQEEEGHVLTTVTQYDYPTCESLGLLKMDFLGLRNLTIITDAVNSVKANHGVDISLTDMIHSALDDEKTYELLQRGDASGIFQLESCLAGNTLIGKEKISDLYEKWVKGEARETTLSIDLAKGVRKRNKILDVVQSGVKPVYRMVLSSGRMIEATEEHKFMTSNGWKRLGDIDIESDKVIVDQRTKSAQYYRECVDCKTQLSEHRTNNPKRCYKCSATFHSNPSKEKSRKAISESSLKTYENGRVVWNKGLKKETNDILMSTGRKISASLMGRNYKKETLSPEEYDTWVKEVSKKMSGEGNPMFGKTPHHAKGGYRDDIGHYVRSTWEADYARVLNHLNIEYEYEYKTFDITLNDGRRVTYTPDFYIPKEDRYVEIKGFMRDLDREKIEKVQEQHGITLDVVSKSEFAELQFKYKDLLNWECPSLPDKTDFESIASITYVNEQMTYDIAMEAPLNNFLANGIMVHNSGMRSLLKNMAPTKFEDIVAVLALYRPGPMGMDAHIAYADRKNGRAPVRPIHPELEEPLKDILGETFGLCIYQEQIMQIAQKVAGYSLSQADILRRAMGKKKKSELDKQEDAFRSGMKERGYSQEAFQALWDTLLPFADYAFNKCVSGDTRVKLSSSGSDSNGTVTVEELYNRLHVNLLPPSTRWEGQKHTGACLHCKREDRPAVWRGRCRACKSWYIKFNNSGLKAMSLDSDGRIRPRRIKDVHYNGEKEAFKVTLSDGKSITSTFDHRHMTPDGWRQVVDLKVGDSLLTMGSIDNAVSSEKYNYRLTEGEKTYAGSRLPTPHRTGENSVGYVNGGSMLLREWTETQEWSCSVEGCEKSRESGNRIERAHLDGNRTNNDPSNLRMMCASHHKKWDYENNGRLRRNQVGNSSVPVEIVSIDNVGVIPVYDLEMDSDAGNESVEHSWVGNGIVTHNSHSAGYALLSYVTAYLKAHYPEEYMAALLTSVSTKPEQTALYLNECKKMGIEVTPPSIIASEKNYSPKIKQIVFGLNSVRGLGGQTVDDLLKYRDGDKYDNIPTLLEHIPVGALNKKVFEGLIFGGALDTYGHNRRSLEDSLIPMLSNIKKRRNEQEDGQVSLFDAYEVKLPEIIIPELPEYPKREKLSKERHILGLYLSDHPLSSMGETLESHSDRTIIDIITNPPVESSDFGAGEKTVIAGVVTSTMEKTTRKGEKMLLATIEDVTGEIETIAFPKTYSAMGPMFQDDIYKVSGTVRNEEDRGISMIIDSYELLEIDEETGKVPLWLKMYEGEATEDAVKELKTVLKKSSGDTPVRVSMKRSDGSVMNIRLGTEYSVKSSPVFAQRLMALFGSKIFGKWG